MEGVGKASGRKCADTVKTQPRLWADPFAGENKEQESWQELSLGSEWLSNTDLRNHSGKELQYDWISLQRNLCLRANSSTVFLIDQMASNKWGLSVERGQGNRRREACPCHCPPTVAVGILKALSPQGVTSEAYHLVVLVGWSWSDFTKRIQPVTKQLKTQITIAGLWGGSETSTWSRYII